MLNESWKKTFSVLCILPLLLLMMGAGSQNQRILLDIPDSDPTLDADGTHFLYVNIQKGEDRYFSYLYRCDLEGGNRETLMLIEESHYQPVEVLKWAPSKLAAVVEKEGATDYSYLLLDLKTMKVTPCPPEVRFCCWVGDRACFWNRWQIPKNLLFTSSSEWAPETSPPFTEKGSEPAFSGLFRGIFDRNKIYFLGDGGGHGWCWGYDLAHKTFFRTSFPSFSEDFAVSYDGVFHSGFLLHAFQKGLYLVREGEEDWLLMDDAHDPSSITPIGENEFLFRETLSWSPTATATLYRCELGADGVRISTVLGGVEKFGKIVGLSQDGKTLWYWSSNLRLLALDVPTGERWPVWLLILLPSGAAVGLLLYLFFRLKNRGFHRPSQHHADNG
jgi:hypothetical protein